jgi:DNA polymerase-3 subunit epsilon
MLIKDAVFCVIDCETTGLDPATDRVVEIAAVACSTTEVLGMWATLVDGRPVTPDNSAIHGLVNEDLIGAPDWKTGYEGLERFCRYFDQRGEITVPTAHNAAFDQGFVEPDGQPWLCTSDSRNTSTPTRRAIRTKLSAIGSLS